MTDLNISILYGSETGTAQDIAEQIWKYSKRCYFLYFVLINLFIKSYGERFFCPVLYVSIF